MAGEIDIVDIQNELGGYVEENQREVRNMVYQGSELDPYVETISKVKGEFPAYMDVMGDVVQEFVDEWTPLGQHRFQVRMLKGFRQKVNLALKPHSMLASYLSWMHQENASLEDMPISQWIMQRHLGPKVQANINKLMGQGTFNTGTGVFGDSMDGLITVLTQMVASENAFRVPLPALTDNNIVGVVDAFEESLPEIVGDKVVRIFMSSRNKKRYKKRYRTLYGTQNDYGKDQTMETWLDEREIVGLRCLNGSDLIFATVEGNMIKLVDEFDPPAITDIQKLDYVLKIFMEFVLGINFWASELVFVSDYGGTVRGLTTNHSLFYPETPTTPIAVS